MYKNYLIDYIIRDVQNHPLTGSKFKNIVINTTNNNLIQNQKNIYGIINSLNKSIGQCPKLKKAKNSVSAFSVRVNSVIGTKINLNKTLIKNFLLKFVFTILPNDKHWQNLKQQKKTNNYFIFNIGFKNLSFWFDLKELTQTGLHIQLIIQQQSKKKDFLFFLSKYNINIKQPL